MVEEQSRREHHIIHEIPKNCIQTVSRRFFSRSTAGVKTSLGAGAGARAEAGAARRGTRWAFAAARRVAAWPALATATGSRATVAGAAGAIHLHTNVGRLPLNTPAEEKWTSTLCFYSFWSDKICQKRFVSTVLQSLKPKSGWWCYPTSWERNLVLSSLRTA